MGEPQPATKAASISDAMSVNLMSILPHKYCDEIIFTPRLEDIGHQLPRNMKSISFEYLVPDQQADTRAPRLTG